MVVKESGARRKVAQAARKVHAAAARHPCAVQLRPRAYEHLAVVQLLDLAPQFGEGFGEDRLAVRVAASLPHIGEVRLVGLGARRGRGLSRSW